MATPLTDQEIIKLLDDTGHLLCPFGDPREILIHPDNLTLEDPEVHAAISSYQDMHSIAVEPMIAKHYPRRTSAAIRQDGQVGPAMRELFEQPRCQCPDYEVDKRKEAAEARGSGNWRGCWDVGDFHSVKVKFLNEPPSFLDDDWDVIWERVVDSYTEVGLLITRDDDVSRANINISFVRGSGWIGLAIVSNRETCGGQIWAKFEQNYRPRNLVSEWTSLVKHELGHNTGMSHSRGGVMNAYILGGQPVS